MRIVAGKHRGRSLGLLASSNIRPTADRTREAVFNALCHGNAKIGQGAALRAAVVLDGFAGTGAVGLEAASRGAAQVTLMELDNKALDLCRQNISNLDENKRVTALAGDCLNPVKTHTACDLIFLDPPYGSELAGVALIALGRAGWIRDNALCVIELAAKEQLKVPTQTRFLDQRHYGAAKIAFLRWAD